MLRDQLRDSDYFDSAISHSEKFIAEEIDYLKSSTTIKPLVGLKTSAGLWSDTLDKLEFCYSRGDNLESFRQDIINTLKFREMQKTFADALPREEAKRRVEWERLDFSNYKKALSWLAFSLAVGASKDYLLKLFHLIDNQGLDTLLDRIAVKLGDNNRPVAGKLLHPKPYSHLLDAVDAAPSEQSTLMNQFMDTWYPACAKNGFYDTHNITNNFGYGGYWCFEAALVTLVFKIDDSGYRNHKYYPSALVHGD